MAKRYNPGKPGDLPLVREGLEFNDPESGMCEKWNLYDRGPKRGFTRWKLSAAPETTVLGKANYGLCVRDGNLWTTDDGHKLQTERPSLFEIVALIAQGLEPTPESAAEESDEMPESWRAIMRTDDRLPRA